MILINPIKKPSWFQRLQWVLDPVKFMESAFSEYPDLFSASISYFADDLLFVHNPQALQQILTSDRHEFSSPGEYNKVLEPLTGVSSLFSLDGEKHKRERKLLMPSFHGERMHAYGHLIQKITEQVFSQFSPNQPFIARNATQQISLQVILQAIFGLYEGERCQQIAQLVRSLLNYFNSPFNSLFLFFTVLQQDLGPWSPWGSFLRTRQKLDDLIYQEIKERQQNPTDNRIDILALMMSAQDENGEKLSEQQLRDELMLLLFAGHDTTAIAMSWALYWIHRYPEVKQKLLAELNQANLAEPMGIYKLPYLTAVCQETLRIKPVAMLTFPREVVKPVELLGYKLNPGMVVIGCIYLLHQREDLYPSAQEFKPERFLERQYSPYEFMPFGGGVRRCLGEALAQYELKLAIATILSNYQLKLVDNKPIKAVRRGVILNPQGGVRMVFQGKR
jgi:cytochrome P450